MFVRGIGKNSMEGEGEIDEGGGEGEEKGRVREIGRKEKRPEKGGDFNIMCTSFFFLCRTSCLALYSVTPPLRVTWVRGLRLRLPSWSTSPSSVLATQQSCTSILSSRKYKYR